MPSFSEADVQRILKAALDQHWAMAGGAPAMVPRPRSPRIAPIARKTGRVLWVKGGQFVYWSGLAAVIFMTGWWMGLALTG